MNQGGVGGLSRLQRTFLVLGGGNRNSLLMPHSITGSDPPYTGLVRDKANDAVSACCPRLKWQLAVRRIHRYFGVIHGLVIVVGEKDSGHALLYPLAHCAVRHCRGNTGKKQVKIKAPKMAATKEPS